MPLSKINKLLSTQPKGAVMLSSWLSGQGYDWDLQKRYRKSGWFQSIGHGAMLRTGDSLNYEGALYALQKQAHMSIHPGARTALSLLGSSQYLELAPSQVILFGTSTENLPRWFKNQDWGLELRYHQSSFLPPDLGITEIDIGTFSIRVSTDTRALMECLYLAPQDQDLFECYEIMEGLNTLRPKLVQSLLEACSSIKVKRLFMYMAEKAQHDWVKYLNLEKVDFGKGKRSIVSKGIFIPKYQITVPIEIEDHAISKFI